MAILRGTEIAGFINNPPESIDGLLVYGPNESRISEITAAVVKSVIGAADDPFNLVILNENQFKESPGLLRDEMLALSFTGGRKVIWVKEPGAAFTRQLSGFFIDSLGGNLLVVQTGPLTKSSAVRKTFETTKQAVCIACYEDTVKDLTALIVQKVSEHGKKIEPATTNLLIESIGVDRSLILSEIEKLLLFCAGQNSISPESIMALSGDPLGASLDELLDRTLTGDVTRCTSKFRELTASGIQPAQIISTLSNQLTRLQKFRLDIDKGQNPELVIKNARPPIFFKRQATMKRQLAIWHNSALEKALAVVFEAILLTRQNVDLAESICERALITLSKTAQSNAR